MVWAASGTRSIGFRTPLAPPPPPFYCTLAADRLCVVGHRPRPFVGTYPRPNASPWYGVFFIAFVVFGSFLALDLFIGTLLDAFMENSGSFSLLTDEQKAFVRAMRLLLKTRLPAAAYAPKSRLRRPLYRLVHSVAFETFISLCIIANIAFLSMEYYDQPRSWADMLTVANYVFVGIFTAEALLKIVALGPRRYFAKGWNRFDLFVVIISLAALAFDGPATSVFRMLRILRLFRLVRFCKGLQLCFTTLLLALPSLINIIAVMVLIMFIFGVMGVELFGRVPVDTGGGLTHNVNFSNLYYATVLLFTISTTETWPDVMDDCRTGLPSPSPWADRFSCNALRAPLAFSGPQAPCSPLSQPRAPHPKRLPPTPILPAPPPKRPPRCSTTAGLLHRQCYDAMASLYCFFLCVVCGTVCTSYDIYGTKSPPPPHAGTKRRRGETPPQDGPPGKQARRPERHGRAGTEVS